MKKILFFLISFVCLHYTAVAQEPSSILTLGGDKLYSYEKVFEAPGKTKEQIFDALKSWVIKTVKSQSNTNYFDEAGKGTVSTTISYPVAFNSTVDFKLNIDIKEGQYKVSAASCIYQNMQGLPMRVGA
ncbi:MAG: DUF4468 domain-containing protein, partial [Flavipsychrobacter sp.]|nr:DUF4468 domain-containing protein [Flavipsychrobacter sp.]